MNAILKFNLPEEQEEHMLALKGSDYMSVCFELDQWLRGEIKYQERKDADTLQEVRDKLHEFLKDYDLFIR